MFKLLLLTMIVMFMTSCGVDTSSSSSSSAVVPVNPTDPTDPVDPTDPTDPVDPTDPTDPVDPTDPTDNNCTEDSIYECNDAVYDASSCTASGYLIAQDASYNGDELSENGSDFFNVENQGLAIRSEHLEGSTVNLPKTWVTLYYKSFPSPTNLELQGYTNYTLEDFFQLSYDIAWSDTSIDGIDRTMYMKTNQGEKSACHRLVLDNIDGTLISVQKVFR